MTCPTFGCPPGARLTVPFTELRQTSLGNIMGYRLTALPVSLRG